MVETLYKMHNFILHSINLYVGACMQEANLPRNLEHRDI